MLCTDALHDVLALYEIPPPFEVLAPYELSRRPGGFETITLKPGLCVALVNRFAARTQDVGMPGGAHRLLYCRGQRDVFQAGGRRVAILVSPVKKFHHGSGTG